MDKALNDMRGYTGNTKQTVLFGVSRQEASDTAGEIDRYARVNPQLGDSYLRAPRWGTYLSRRHLDAIGGAAKVVAEVQPACVRDIGPVTYFQLSERVDDALSPATEARRAKFEALVAPLRPPG